MSVRACDTQNRLMNSDNDRKINPATFSFRLCLWLCHLLAATLFERPFDNVDLLIQNLFFMCHDVVWWARDGVNASISWLFQLTCCTRAQSWNGDTPIAIKSQRAHTLLSIASVHVQALIRASVTPCRSCGCAVNVVGTHERRKEYNVLWTKWIIKCLKIHVTYTCCYL